MDQLASDSWTTISTTTTPSPALHHHGPLDVGPVYLPAGAPKTSDIASEGGKRRFAALELESAGTDRSWMHRIQWFRNTRSHRDAAATTHTRNNDAAIHQQLQYVGGPMETAPPISPRNYEVPTVNTQHKDPKHTNSNAFNRIASWMTANTTRRASRTFMSRSGHHPIHRTVRQFLYLVGFPRTHDVILNLQYCSFWFLV